MTAVAGADQLSLGASPQVGTTVAASLSADLAITAATLTAVTSITLGAGVLTPKDWALLMQAFTGV